MQRVSCAALTITGGVAQVAGFGLGFYEVSRTQRREFPEYVPFHHRMARFFVRLFGRRRDVVIRSVTAHAAISAGGDLTVEVSRSPAATLDGRVARLEVQIEDLGRKQREDNEPLHVRVLRSING